MCYDRTKSAILVSYLFFPIQSPLQRSSTIGIVLPKPYLGLDLNDKPQSKCLKWGNPGPKYYVLDPYYAGAGAEVIKQFSRSIQLSMKLVLLRNLKLLTIANYFLLIIAEHENFSGNKYENANYCWRFHVY